MIPEINEMYHKTRKPTGFMKHYYTLWSIVEGLEAKDTFEFGTGISTKVICDAISRTGGHHTSCDTRVITDTGLSEAFLEENKERYTFIQGDSRVVDLPTGPFDFVLHDGSHVPGIVRQDLRKVLKFMKKNSIIIIHDTFNDKYPGMRNAVQTVLAEVENEMITLPYSYGITIIRIIEDFGNGTLETSWRK